MAAILKKWQNGKNREASTSNIEEYALPTFMPSFMLLTRSAQLFHVSAPLAVCYLVRLINTNQHGKACYLITTRLLQWVPSQPQLRLIDRCDTIECNKVGQSNGRHWSARRTAPAFYSFFLV